MCSTVIFVFRHLPKMYEGIGKMKFKQEGGKSTKSGCGFWDKHEGSEFVATTGYCDCTGQVS